MASGSTSETENHLILASDLDYISAEVRERYLGEVKMIQGSLATLIANLP